LISAFLLTQGTRHADSVYCFHSGQYSFWPRSCRERCPWLAQRTAKVLLVHGASPQRAGFLLAGLRAHHLDVTTLSVAHEPTLEDIEQGVHLAREHGIGAVVSLGGGAVIDAGKAIAALVPASGPVMEYLEVVGNGRLLEGPSAAVCRYPDYRRYRRGSHEKCGD
jgi:alcohol dehydrogenase class IV